ncbi:MAG: 50S ribosomal protein L10 [Clostridia bacterium]|nr:50S ribosomal protein L10 [Clostridia bacterium]
MNTIREQKEQVVSEIKEKIEKCASFVVIDYMGLTVDADTAFRKEFRDAKIEYKVVKNTMLKIALNELGYTEFDHALNGPTAIAFSYDDIVAPAKISAEKIKKLNKMEIKCGMIEKVYADANMVNALANIPPKQTLLSMLCNVLQAPIRNLAVVIDQAAKKAAEA